MRGLLVQFREYLDSAGICLGMAIAGLALAAIWIGSRGDDLIFRIKAVSAAQASAAGSQTTYCAKLTFRAS